MDYGKSWDERMQEKGWTKASFKSSSVKLADGKEAESLLGHDTQRWTFLQDTFKSELVFNDRTVYEKGHGLVYQLKARSKVDELLAVFKRSVNHHHKGLSMKGFIQTASKVEQCIRNIYGGLDKKWQNLFLDIGMSFCLPLEDSPHTSFAWRDESSIDEILDCPNTGSSIVGSCLVASCLASNDPRSL